MIVEEFWVLFCFGVIEWESRIEEFYFVLYDDNVCGCNVVVRESLIELCFDVVLEEGSFVGCVLGLLFMGDRVRGWVVVEVKFVYLMVCVMFVWGEEKR